MCGIAGKLSFSATPVRERDVAAMNRAQRHRGPDDAGIFISPDQAVGLGHQRLSIVDLSATGHQPMPYLNRYWIVFNGEIYNFRQQRALLEKQGYRFHSHTDTEVIMALYDRYGEQCLAHLHGMFAFALYDTKLRQLFVARDRVGKKPLKYYHDGRTFMFASELKAILTQSEYRREPDIPALDLYLSLQYVPAPLTGFKNIKKLEPGHYMTVDVARGHVETQRYWQLNYRHKLNLTTTEWQRRIRDTLEEAVQLRMMADVPVGAFLSGGVDSSAVVALMQQQVKQPVKTFSIGFEESAFDERPYARRVAKYLGTDHTEFVVQPTNVDILPMLVRTLEEPLADHGALPMYFLSELTRRHVTVALNGDGGDENFAGYDRYTAVAASALYDRWKPASQVVQQLLMHMPGLSDRVRRFLAALPQNAAARYLTFVQYLPYELRQELYTADTSPMLEQQLARTYIDRNLRAALATNPVDQALWVDFKTYLPNALLPKVDLTTMAFGLEARSPFLDHKLLELTARMPSTLKLRRLTQSKYLLKEMLQEILPADILHRPKQGFGIPLQQWFTDELAGYARSLLLARDARIHHFVRREALDDLLDRHVASGLFGRQIWALLILELWWREFFD